MIPPVPPDPNTPVYRSSSPKLQGEVEALQHRVQRVELIAYVALAIGGGLLAGVLVAIVGGILHL